MNLTANDTEGEKETSEHIFLPSNSTNFCNSKARGSVEPIVNVLQLEQHCKNLEDELDQVKFQIVKIVSDKNDFSKENAVLKTYQNAFSALTEQNLLLRRKIEELSVMDNSHDNQYLLKRMPIETGTDKKEKIIAPDIDRSSPDGQEKDIDQQTHCNKGFNWEEEILSLKNKLEEFENAKIEDRERFESQIQETKDRNKYTYSIMNFIIELIVFPFLGNLRNVWH